MSEGDLAPDAATHLEIALQNPNGFSEVDPGPLASWLRSLVAEVVPEGRSIAVRFVGDREMTRLNRQFRGRDSTTDVLSFPGDAGAGGGHIGDIAISLPAARRQAGQAGHAIPAEVKILMLHGLLHCVGHDHETDGGEMDQLERRLRRRWVGSDV